MHSSHLLSAAGVRSLPDSLHQYLVVSSDPSMVLSASTGRDPSHVVPVRGLKTLSILPLPPSGNTTKPDSSRLLLCGVPSSDAAAEWFHARLAGVHHPSAINTGAATEAGASTASRPRCGAVLMLYKLLGLETGAETGSLQPRLSRAVMLPSSFGIPVDVVVI